MRKTRDIIMTYQLLSSILIQDTCPLLISLNLIIYNFVINLEKWYSNLWLVQNWKFHMQQRQSNYQQTKDLEPRYQL